MHVQTTWKRERETFMCLAICACVMCQVLVWNLEVDLPLQLRGECSAHLPGGRKERVSVYVSFFTVLNRPPSVLSEIHCQTWYGNPHNGNENTGIHLVGGGVRTVLETD